MGKLPLIVAVANAMWALPASAWDVIPSKPEVALAQWYLCVGPDIIDAPNRDRRRAILLIVDDCTMRVAQSSLKHARRGGHEPLGRSGTTLRWRAALPLAT